MLFHEANRLVEPVRVAAQAFQFARRKPFPRVLRRPAERLQMTGAHQDREEIQRPAEEARCFFDALTQEFRAFECAELGRHQAQHHTLIAARQIAQWFEAACAFAVVPLQMIQFRPEPVVIVERPIAASQDMMSGAVVHPQLSAEQIHTIASARVWSRVKSPDGRWTVLVDDEQRCRMISSIERRCIDVPASMVSTVVFSPDSQRLAIGTTDGRILILRSPDWTVEFNIGRGPAVRSVDWSPKGDRIALCTEAGDIKLLTSHDMTSISLRRLPMSCLNCVRFSSDANQLIVGCGDWKSSVDSALLILDSESLNLTNVWNSEAPIAFVRVGDEGNEILCCDWSGRMNLLSLMDLRILNSQWIPKDLVAPLAFSIQADDAGVITGAF